MISDTCFRTRCKTLSLYLEVLEYSETQSPLNNCHVNLYFTLKIALNHFIFMWFGTRRAVTKASPAVKFICRFNFKFPEISMYFLMWCFHMTYNKNETNWKLQMQIFANSRCL